jgi:valyl-tRNA synthetase
LTKLTSKLAGGEFARNAPPDIVAKDQQRIAELRTEIAQLSAQTSRVTQLLRQ